MLKEQLLLKCIDKTSGEWEFLSNREGKRKKAFVLTKKKIRAHSKKLSHTSICVDYSKPMR